MPKVLHLVWVPSRTTKSEKKGSPKDKRRGCQVGRKRQCYPTDRGRGKWGRECVVGWGQE